MTRGTDDVRGVLERHPDGIEVRFERWYPTDPDDLWEAVTVPARVARWLGPIYGDLRVGGRYELRMGQDVPDAADNATGEVLACDPPRTLAVTWVFPDETSTRVDVALRRQGEGTLLVLRHTGLADAAARGYGGGWHACLDQLDDDLAGRPVRAWDDLYAAASPAYAHLPEDRAADA